MADLSNLIPSEVLAQALLLKLRKNLVAADAVGNMYNTVLRNGGDSVKIATISDTSASDYTKLSTLSYAGLDSTGQTLYVDQLKSFDYGIDLIDIKQSPINITNTVLQQATRSLVEAADTYLLTSVMCSGAGLTGGTGGRALGTTGTPINVYNANSATGSGAVEYLGKLQQRLDEADAINDGRYVICPPWFASNLVAQRVLETAGSVPDNGVWDNGRVGRAMGFDIRVSTNLTNYNTTASAIFAGYKDSVQFVDTMVEASIIPLTTKFAYGARGLYIYGAKVISTTGLALGFISQV